MGAADDGRLARVREVDAPRLDVTVAVVVVPVLRAIFAAVRVDRSLLGVREVVPLEEDGGPLAVVLRAPALLADRLDTTDAVSSPLMLLPSPDGFAMRPPPFLDAALTMGTVLTSVLGDTCCSSASAAALDTDSDASTSTAIDVGTTAADALSLLSSEVSCATKLDGLPILSILSRSSDSCTRADPRSASFPLFSDCVLISLS